MPEMDYRKVFGRMAELGMTQRGLAEAIKMGRSQLNLKLNGKYAFKQSEIEKICNVLQIPVEEIGNYFFTPKVEKSQLFETGSFTCKEETA